jgi:nitroreductase
MHGTDTATALHPLLAERTSPRDMDPAHVLGDDALHALLEAARWAPSSMNGQPWRFLVGRRGDDVFATIVGTLAEGNRGWVAGASALLLVVSDTLDAEERPRRHAEWDAGQAVAHLTVQAEAMGLGVRQMGGFSADAARAAFGIPARYAVLTVVAVGRRREGAATPPRVRRPLAETAFSTWGTPIPAGGAS